MIPFKDETDFHNLAEIIAIIWIIIWILRRGLNVYSWLVKGAMKRQVGENVLCCTDRSRLRDRCETFEAARQMCKCSKLQGGCGTFEASGQLWNSWSFGTDAKRSTFRDICEMFEALGQLWNVRNFRKHSKLWHRCKTFEISGQLGNVSNFSREKQIFSPVFVIRNP